MDKGIEGAMGNLRKNAGGMQEKGQRKRRELMDLGEK